MRNDFFLFSQWACIHCKQIVYKSKFWNQKFICNSCITSTTISNTWTLQRKRDLQAVTKSFQISARWSSTGLKFNLCFVAYCHSTITYRMRWGEILSFAHALPFWAYMLILYAFFGGGGILLCHDIDIVIDVGILIDIDVIRNTTSLIGCRFDVATWKL